MASVEKLKILGFESTKVGAFISSNFAQWQAQTKSFVPISSQVVLVVKVETQVGIISL